MNENPAQANQAQDFLLPTRHEVVLEAVLAYLLAKRSQNRTDPVSTVRSTDRYSAARGLLAAVSALPELDPKHTPRAAAQRSSDLDLAELEAGVAELEYIDGTTERFRFLAEEIAARARLLQEEQPVLRPACSSVIQRLTAVVRGGPVFVFGLSRRHRADWKARAKAARAALERFERAAESRTPATVRSALPVTDARPVASEPEHAAPVDLPNLRKAAENGAVVVIGGAGRHAVREAVARQAGIEIEWIETRGRGTRLVEPVVMRVRSGDVAAVVLVEGAMLHRHSQPLVRAARLALTPIAYARKGGVTQVIHALGEIERRLAGHGCAEPAA